MSNTSDSDIQVAGQQVSQGFERAISQEQKASCISMGRRVIATLPKPEAKLGKRSSYYNKAVDIYERTFNQKYFEEVKTSLRCENLHIF